MTLSKPFIVAYCRKTIHNHAEIDDVVQLVYIKIFTKIMDYDSTKPGLPWILAITHFECLTLNKKILRRKESLLDSETSAKMTDEVTSPESEVMRQDLSKSIHEVLTDMNEMDRAAIINYLYGEIDATVNSATIRKRWQRAKGRFLSLWEGKYG